MSAGPQVEPASNGMSWVCALPPQWPKLKSLPWRWRKQRISKWPRRCIRPMCPQPLSPRPLPPQPWSHTQNLSHRSSARVLLALAWVAWLWRACVLCAEANPVVAKSPSKSVRHERTVTNPTFKRVDIVISHFLRYSFLKRLCFE